MILPCIINSGGGGALFHTDPYIHPSTNKRCLLSQYSIEPNHTLLLLYITSIMLHSAPSTAAAQHCYDLQRTHGPLQRQHCTAHTVGSGDALLHGVQPLQLCAQRQAQVYVHGRLQSLVHGLLQAPALSKRPRAAVRDTRASCSNTYRDAWFAIPTQCLPESLKFRPVYTCRPPTRPCPQAHTRLGSGLQRLVRINWNSLFDL